MDFETQQALLRALSLCCRHYAAVALSMRNSRSFDAVRILVMSAIVCVTDRVLRESAQDIQSEFSLHYSGNAEGPCLPFGIRLGGFTIETDMMKFNDPDLAVCRSMVLDYFAAQEKFVQDDHVIFSWENAMTVTAEKLLLEQVSLELGFPTADAKLAGEYTSGDRLEILDTFPEYGFFRDVVFVFKFMMTPSIDNLPEFRDWMPIEATLSWKYVEGVFVIKGFGGKTLKIIPIVRTPIAPPDSEEGGPGEKEGDKVTEKKREERGLFSSLKKFIKGSMPRVPPSGANPSEVCGQEVITEDDVLHLRTLPDFGSLSQRDSELLISYLTVPYLRIPLVLGFFANQLRVRSLASRQLRNVLDCVMFEPAEWSPPSNTMLPAVVPASTRRHLATPCGMLFRELQCSPKGVISALNTLLDLSLDMDTGRFNSSSSMIILYVTRLLVRVEEYMNYIIGHHAWAKLQPKNDLPPPHNPDDEDDLIDDNMEEIKTNSTGNVVQDEFRNWKELIDSNSGRVYYWNKKTHETRWENPAAPVPPVAEVKTEDKSMDDSSPKNKEIDSEGKSEVSVDFAPVDAHYPYQTFVRGLNCSDSTVEELKYLQKSVRHIIDSEIFPMIERWALEATKRDQIPDACILHAHLCIIFKNVRRDQLTENIVSVLLSSMCFLNTRFKYTGDIRGDRKNVKNIESESEEAQGLDISEPEMFDLFQRHRSNLEFWLKTHPRGCNDVMESVTRVVTFTGTRQKPADNFLSRRWRSMTVKGCGGRYIPNFVEKMKTLRNLTALPGENFEAFMLRRMELQQVDIEINIQLFDFSLKASRLQNIAPEFYDHLDYKLVFGNLSIVQACDVSKTKHRHWARMVGRRHDLQLWDADKRHCPQTCSRPFAPDRLFQIERWIEPLVDIVQKKLPGYTVFLPNNESEERVYLLQALKPPSDETKFPQLKDLILLKDSMTIHIYNVVEHGRHWYRQLVFSNTMNRCYQDMDPSLVIEEGSQHASVKVYYAAGSLPPPVTPSSSLVISRRLYGVTEELVPARLLAGLLPSVLLEDYVFWRRFEADGNTKLIGVQTSAAMAKVNTPTEICVRLVASDVKDFDATGRQWTAIVTRYPAKPRAEVVEREFVKTEEEAVDDNLGADEAEDADVNPFENKKDDGGDPCKQYLTLLDLMYCLPDSPLSDIAKTVERLDNLSHILVWTRTPVAIAHTPTRDAPDFDPTASVQVDDNRPTKHVPVQPVTIDIIEIPRVGITLVAKTMTVKRFINHRPDNISVTRFYSASHAGFYVSNSRSQFTQTLYRDIPHAVVLENEHGEQQVIIPATSKPSRPYVATEQFFSQLLLDRTDKMWLQNLPIDRRHYVYPVHASGAFLFLPTVVSALYLLVIRWINRQYDAVFKLTAACVTDVPLTDEEQQIWGLLGEFKADCDPNAHACRLRLSMVTECTYMRCPWDNAVELSMYLKKLSHISSGCRLSHEEELHILNSLSGLSTDLANRKKHVKALVERKESCKLVLPTVPKFTAHDSIVDKTWAQDVKGGLSEALMRTTYRQPEGKQGVDAIEEMNSWLRNGLRLSGGADNLGFIFFYEIMTNGYQFCILPNDNGHTLASLMVRFLPPDERLTKNLLMSLLRTLIMNYQLLEDPELPLYEDKRKIKFATMFAGMTTPFSILVKSLQAFLVAKAATLKFNPENMGDGPAIDNTVVVTPMDQTPRGWASARVTEFTCASRTLAVIDPENDKTPPGHTVTQNTIKCFASFPLALIGLQRFVKSLTRTDRGMEPLSPDIPFDVTHHPYSRSHIAQSMIDRLNKDCAYYAVSSNESKTPQMLGLTEAEVRALIAENDQNGEFCQAIIQKMYVLLSDLTLLKFKDEAAVRQGVSLMYSIANDVSFKNLNAVESRARLSFTLGQQAGVETPLDIEFLSALLLSSNADRHFEQLNPFVTPALAKFYSISANMMANVVRLGQVQRAMLLARELLGLIEKVGAQPSSSVPGVVAASDNGGELQSTGNDSTVLCNEIMLTADSLASELTTQRHFVTKAADGVSVNYDPRYLVFEYAYNLQLRKSQITLVTKFLGTIARGESICHQMIMGAGKTTVVGPLLALLLTDGKTLVTQVVPGALLDFSLTVMRERFTAIVMKPVYTFNFSRTSTCDDQIFRKFTLAQSRRAILVSTPTAIKSFALKFLELLHMIDTPESIKRAKESGFSAFARSLGSVFGLNKTKRKAKGAIIKQPEALEQIEKKKIAGYRREAYEVGRVLDLLRSGALILDEVDWILHPLKSELNWPLGTKEPLDFTKGQVGRGLRWQIPWFLLDGILYPFTGHMTVPFEESRQARAILYSLKLTMVAGFKKRFLQSTPHLVLLNKKYYDQAMLPLLCQWMLVWLSSKGIKGIPDSILMSYLMEGGTGSAEAANVVNSRLTGPFIKMLNLSHSWLTSFLPFVLGKIDRVSFGLLAAHDLERMGFKEDGLHFIVKQTGIKSPLSRIYLAVPFVGKDVPSASSEFAHPDVVIGLTCLGYRYEGVRLRDFKILLRDMIVRMEEDEGGPYFTRSKCILWAQWIRFAGGRVRGWDRAGAVNSHRNRKQVKEERWLAKQNRKLKPSAEACLARIVEHSLVTDVWDLWPLHLVDLTDPVVVDVLYTLLHKLPNLVEYWLNNYVFPKTCEHQGLKLCANGQALGGDMMFSRRIGFSGTPSDLLPLELGSCHYEEGSDGQMLSVLTHERICSFEVMPSNWSVESILRTIATANPPYHALIDTGALVTGLTNEQVARFLISAGIPHKGVVFLDEFDRKRILVKATMRVMKLSDMSGISKGERFTFFDQVHTTGMDIPQVLNAVAVITLGKDMTFRDYAQGAYRMRGIGKGQRIHNYVIPEIEELIISHTAAGRGEAKGVMNPATMLRDINAWLVINSMKSEHIQFNMLCDQQLQNIWVKKAFSKLLSYHQIVGTQPPPLLTGPDGKVQPETAEQKEFKSELEYVNRCVDVFRNRLDWAVENSIPKEEGFGAKLTTLCEQNAIFLVEAEKKAIAEEIIARATQASRSNEVKSKTIDGVDANKDKAFNSEQVQEQEEEQEQEQEQEQHEMEIEPEDDAEETVIRKSFSRKDEGHRSWRVAKLGLTPEACASQFYPASDFITYSGSAKKPLPSLPFPSYMLVSNNYYDPAFRNTAYRRLKNVNIILEWIPDTEQVKVKTVERNEAGETNAVALKTLTDKQNVKLQRCYSLFDIEGKGSISELGMKEVLNALDVGSEQQAGFGALSTFADMKHMMEHETFAQLQNGRYWIAVTLLEAEHLRGIMHARLDRPLLDGSRAAIALRHDGILLDSSLGYASSLDYQQTVTESNFRFINSEHTYDPRQVNLVIRSLESKECKARRDWFLEIRSCRRRAQREVRDAPVARVFQMEDQFSLLEFRALVARARLLFRKKGMLALDAFRAFDYDRNGQLSCSELYGGLTWLGMELTSDDIYNIVRSVDKKNNGTIDYVDFCLTFKAEDEQDFVDDNEDAKEALANLLIEPRNIKELSYAHTKEYAEYKEVSVPDSVLAKFKCKVKKVEKFVEVWSSEGSTARSELTIWAPEVDRGLFKKRNKQNICLGFFADNSFQDPLKDKKNNRCYLEITDESVNMLQSSNHLDTVLATYFPFPKKYSLVWSTIRTETPLYCWKPVPPTSDFVVLGMVCTTTPEEPDQDLVRCVPKAWTVPMPPPSAKQLWDDSGLGGKLGAIYEVNSLGNVFANPGHVLKNVEFADLFSQRFFAHERKLKDPSRPKALVPPSEEHSGLPPQHAKPSTISHAATAVGKAVHAKDGNRPSTAAKVPEPAPGRSPSPSSQKR